MRKGTLRILSLALALCMMIGAAPLQFNLTANAADGEYFFDYFKAYRSYKTGTEPTLITNWDHTTIGSGREINVGTTYCSYTEPWIFHDMGNGAVFRLAEASYGLAMEGGEGSWVQVKIRVPKAGTYSIYTQHFLYSAAPIVDHYLAPVDAEDPMAQRYYLGTVDAYSTVMDNAIRLRYNSRLRNVTLEAGDYIFSYKFVGKNQLSTGYFYGLGGIKLGEKGDDEFNMWIDAVDRVIIDTSKELELHPDINGVGISLADADELTVSVDDEKVYAAELIERDGKHFVKVDAKDFGTATLTVNAKMGDLSVEMPHTIQIVEPEALDYLELAAEKNVLEAGETLQLNLNAYQMDGNMMDLNSVTPYFDTSDSNVATVSATGLVKAKTKGNTTITAYLELDGVLRKAEVLLTVSNNPDIQSIEFDAPDSIKIEESTNIYVGGTYVTGDKFEKTDAATVTMVSCEPKNAATFANGVLSAAKVGSVTLRATVPAGDTQSELTIDKTIVIAPKQIIVDDGKPKEIYLDFKPSNTKNPAAPGDATIEDHGWAVNTDETPDKLINASAVSKKYFRFQPYGIACWYQTLKDTTAQLVLDVKVPATGVYELRVDGGAYTGGAKTDIFVDEKYVGDYDFYSKANVPQQADKQLMTVALSAGVHRFAFRYSTTKSTARMPYLYLGSIRLTPVDEMPTFDSLGVFPEKSTLIAGEDTTVILPGKMSDGSPFDFGVNYDGTPSADTYTLAIDDPSGAISYTNGNIKTLKTGDVTFTISGSYAGENFEKSQVISVTNEILSRVEVFSDKETISTGEVANLSYKAYTDSDRELNIDNVEVKATVAPGSEAVLSVKDNVVTPVGNGTGTINVAATFNNVTVNGTIDITVAGVATNLILTADEINMKPTNKTGAQISVAAKSELGQDISTANAEITYKSLDESIITVDETGHVMPAGGVGRADVEVTVKFGEVNIVTDTITFNITLGKTASSYYTKSRVEAMRANATTKEVDSVCAAADWFLDRTKDFTTLLTTQELPRGATVGYRWDPEVYYCRYCGTNLQVEYGNYPWMMDVFGTPFKVQCPDCRRYFPSNDFESFYKLGINEEGNWSYELAKQKNAELVAAGENGFLHNDLYPEKGEGWGVDDGYGYHSGKTVVNTQGNAAEQVHTYIAYYNHWGVWYSQSYVGNKDNSMMRIVDALRDAYLYTGDPKYGRPGAILIDRIADIYPDFYIGPYFPNFFNSDSTMPKGKMVGCIWQHGMSRAFVRGYDAFYDMYDDPVVMDAIQKTASTYKLKNDKSTPKAVRDHIETNLLRQNYKDVRSQNIYGNFGMHQSLIAYTAVVLDTLPESGEMLDWLMASSASTWGDEDVTGGNVLAQIINLVDRDGHGAESGPNYNILWLGSMMTIADVIAGYETYPAGDLYNNPRFIKMFKAYTPLTLTRRVTAPIADSGSTANDGIMISKAYALKGFQYSKDVELAQLAYFMNGNKSDGLEYDNWTLNPERAADDVQAVIDEHGEYDFDRSQQLAGYGFTILRDGGLYENADSAKTIDTQRDFWIYHGGANSHKHADILNLGIEAYGISIAPDLGYPEAADGSDKNVYWFQGTIMHNTVMTNDQSHNRIRSYYNGNPRVNSVPRHFDDSGRVKVMDLDAPKGSTNGTAGENGIFRRSFVMVNVNDENSYGVDFFRVKGGNEHLYNFHALSNEIYETENLNFAHQKMGSYAGPNVPYGTLKHVNGYSYLYDVRRAAYPGNEFAIDFKIRDFREQLPRDDMDIHLRLTMLCDFDFSEVAVAKGQPPQRDGNPEELEFMMARRSGTNLDSLFTAVYEPYNEKRYIKSMEQVDVVRIGGEYEGANDTVKAVKVEQTNGIIDYIVYATNNKVLYRVADTFDFQGAIGVYSTLDGEVIYNYGNDAVRVGDLTGTSAYTGTVLDFTKTIEFDNFIKVKFDSAVDTDALVGKFLIVDNGLTENAAFEISGVTPGDKAGEYIVDIGDLTTITSTKSAETLDAGFNYLLAEGDTFTIPLPILKTGAPVFTPISDRVVEVGSELKFNISATSPVDRELTYSAKELPRGGQFDPETKTFTLIPDSQQLGNNVASFNVTDGIFTETLYVNIDVRNKTTGSSTAVNNPSMGTGGGGAGGTGGTTGGDTEENPKPETPITESDNIDFTVNAESGNTASTELGSVEFEQGYFTESGEGKLSIDRNGNEFELTLNTKAETGEGKLKVELDYTPAADETDTEAIIVTDEQGNVITNAKYENGKVTFYTDSLGKFTVSYNAKGFTDLGNHAWAKKSINALAARGIINGVTETTYCPANNITRADFTTLIVRAFGFTADNAEQFGDVDSSKYYADAVAIAKALGIVNGDSKGNFNPTNAISRQDMMVIIARAAAVAGVELSGENAAQFPDADKVSDYARDAVELLVKAGIVGGSNGMLNPLGTTTRAEIAVILDRLVFLPQF